MRTTFREIIENDLNDSFFDEDAFAEEHDIDGKKISVVIDNDLLTSRKIRAGQRVTGVTGEGIFEGNLLFFVPSARLAKPKSGQVMQFDGKPCTVLHVSEIDGMLTVTLKGALI